MTSSLKQDIAADLFAVYKSTYSNRLLIRGFVFDPGLRLLILYRLSAYFVQNGRFVVLGYVFWQLGILLSSCHISPRAQIAGGVLFPHPTGIVIGDGVILGRDVVVFQNVTLGKRRMNANGYPKVENGVVIYAGAVVAGDVVIGSQAVLGANVFVTHDVAGQSRVVVAHSVVS